MHQLVPPFISEKYANGECAGRLAAVCLFVDTAGFTPLTSALMAHGAEGAEVIAAILQAVFRPLVNAVYDHGGFVAGFAGDSFKAVFAGDDQATFHRCVLAADAMRQQMATQTQLDTRFGRFEFAVKIGVAAGAVDWAIWRGATAAVDQQAAAYTFDGAALNECMTLDAELNGGEVGLSAGVYQRLDTALFHVEERGQHWRLHGIAPQLGGLASNQPIETSPNAPMTTPFMPPALGLLRTSGEFRQVVSVFINLSEIPTGAAGLALQHTLFAALQRHGGYLCRIGRIGAADAGATLLLFWGAPTSVENDLARALNFVLDVQRDISVPLRAGITNQLAYAGFVGAAQREEYTCYGSAVNLAARLMLVAEWHEILLDASSARHAGTAFVCEPKGTRQLKGFATAQPIFGLKAVRWNPMRYPRPLIGRERELAQIEQELERGRNEPTRSRIIQVIGEAGIGKSRLVHAVQMRVRGQWFSCPADQLARQSLHPFRYFLRHYFAQSPTQTDDENKRLFEYGIEALIGVTADAALQRELDRVRSLLGALVDLFWPNSLYAQLDPKGRFDNTLLALQALFKAESARRPLVIQIEDAHWLDPDSALCITQLQRTTAAYPIALLLTARTAPILPAVGDVSTIHLLPLQATELAQLAADVLQTTISPALVELLVNRAEGNPYFAEQLLLFLQEHRLLVPTATGLAPHHADAALPGNVRALLTARLDRLPPTVKHTVQTAAVLGREFDAGLLRHMLAADDAMTTIETAAAADIWRLVRPDVYSFSHDLLRDAAYEMQLRAWQRRMHQLAATTLETYYPDLAPHVGALAHHYERALLNDQACIYLERAADQARHAFENSSALDYGARLIALLRQAAAPHSLINALLNQVVVLEHTGAWAAARAIVSEALELASQHELPALQAQARGWLGHLARLASEYAQALEYQIHALHWYQTSDDATGLAQTLNRIGLIYKDQGAFDQALVYHEQALTTIQTNANSMGVAHTMTNIGLIHWHRGDYAQSLAWYETALQISRDVGDKIQISRIFTNMGLTYWHKGEPDQALHYYGQALATEQQLGNRANTARILGNVGMIYVDTHQYTVALSYLDQALALDRELENLAGVARHLGNSGLIYGNEGQFDRAIALHQQALAIDQALGKEADVVRHRGNIAELYRHQKLYPEALQYYDETIPLLRTMGAKYYLCWQLIQKAEVLFLCGRYAEAYEYTTEGLALALVAGDPSDVVFAHVLLAKLRALDGETEQACTALLTLLADTHDQTAQALFSYTLWQLTGTEPYRESALDLYQTLYAQSHYFLDEQRLNELRAGANG